MTIDGGMAASAVRRFVEHINRVWSELELPQAPDSAALKGQSPFAAGTVGGTVAG